MTSPPAILAAAGRVLALAAALVVTPPAGNGARAQPLIADLSQHLIAITTAFAGTDVMLFGAVDGPGEVIVVVRGPITEQVMRRREQLAGIWINRDRITFRNVPAYYAVAASQPTDQIAPPEVLAQHEIGVQRLALVPVDAEDRAENRIQEFRDALIRNKQREDLYSVAPLPVRFLGPRLFRTTLQFPANVPPGAYQVRTLLLRDGQVISAQSNLLLVSKIGLEADLYDFAHNRPALYGTVAVLIVLVSGYLAGLMFRFVVVSVAS